MDEASQRSKFREEHCAPFAHNAAATAAANRQRKQALTKARENADQSAASKQIDQPNEV